MDTRPHERPYSLDEAMRLARHADEPMSAGQAILAAVCGLGGFALAMWLLGLILPVVREATVQLMLGVFM